MSDSIFLIGKGNPKVPKVIVDGKFYQGSAAEVIEICGSNELLEMMGLKAVLTVAHDIRVRVPANRVHLHLPVDELHETPHQYFDLACGLNVFPLVVHCMAGANRSRVFAAAIAHKVFGMSLEAAIELADPPPSGVVFESFMKWAKA